MQTSPTVARPGNGTSDRTLSRLIKLVAVLLAVGIPLFVGFYWLDRHPGAGPSKVDLAVQQLEQNVASNPNNLGLRLQLAGAYEAADLNDKALAQYGEVVTADKENKSAFVGRGFLLYKIGDLAGASADFQAVIDIMKDAEFAPVDNELQQGLYGLAQVKLDQKKPADAIPLLQRALSIKRTDADAYYLFGLALQQTGEPDRAVKAFQSAVMFVPYGWAEPYQGLAQAYESVGNVDGTAYANGMAALAVDDFVAAKQALAALTTGAFAKDATLGLAMIAEFQGDNQGAIDLYGKVLDLDPGNYAATSGVSRLTGTDAAPSNHPAPAAPSIAPNTGG